MQLSRQSGLYITFWGCKRTLCRKSPILAAVTVDEFCSGKLKSFLCSQRQLLAEDLLRLLGHTAFVSAANLLHYYYYYRYHHHYCHHDLLLSVSILLIVLMGFCCCCFQTDGLNILLCLRKAKKIILKYYRGTRYVTQTAKFTVYLLPTDWKRGLK